MSGFIAKAACRGRRPSQFAGFDGFERQGLVARLLKEREVARFIVAPSGYGKTAIVVEYAETVFAWVHTFFINCQSPCFIRDLDDDSIAEACFSSDKQARLVVFDSVPPLDAQRAERFSDEIDALLSKGCEVIVTCAPSADTLGPLQPDQVRLSAIDLLLDDDELDCVRTRNECAETPSAHLSAAHRVPALVWGEGDSAVTSFLRRSFKEPMPADFLLAMASMYVLEKGTVDDLSAIGPIDIDIVEHMLDAYPHLCYDAERGCFDVPYVSVDDVATALKSQIDSIVARSAFDTKEGLACAWADLLLEEHGNPGRACDVVRIICPRPHRGSWLADHADDLVMAGCFYPSIKLAKVISARASESPLSVKTRVSALEAVSYMLLGDAPGAVLSARRFAFDEAVRRDLRVYCLMVLVRIDSGELRERAEKCLESIAAASDGASPPDCSRATALARAWRASRIDVSALGAEWFRLRMSGASDEALCLVASQLFGMLEHLSNADALSSFINAGDDVAAAESYIRERMEALEGNKASFALSSAALAMEGAHMRGLEYSAGPLSTTALLAIRQGELRLNQQRQQFRRDRSGTPQSARADVRSAAVGAKHAVSAKRSIPILELSMFGRFEASIGGELLDQKAFQRQNVRTLLALLAINLGREVPRVVLMHRMWPEVSDDVARKSFYAAWAHLKSALTLSDGTCPYLVRSQSGCCLDKHHVQTDIGRLEEIMCELQFKERRQRDWASIYVELDEKFTSDLLPSEVKNESVMRARDEYRNRLVDALVAATQSVVESGNPDYGILFGRMAVKRDDVREDAYVALMHAQVASGQIPSAVLTFHACRDVLAEKLGIYPSPKTSEYFESLLK